MGIVASATLTLLGYIGYNPWKLTLSATFLRLGLMLVGKHGLIRVLVELSEEKRTKYNPASNHGIDS